MQRRKFLGAVLVVLAGSAGLNSNAEASRGGVTYYYCGSIWYRPAYQGTTVVYIVEDIESGANTDVEFEEVY